MSTQIDPSRYTDPLIQVDEIEPVYTISTTYPDVHTAVLTIKKNDVYVTHIIVSVCDGLPAFYARVKRLETKIARANAIFYPQGK